MDKSDPAGAEYWRDIALGIHRKETTLPADALRPIAEVVKTATELLNKKLNEQRNK